MLTRLSDSPYVYFISFLELRSETNSITVCCDEYVTLQYPLNFCSSTVSLLHVTVWDDLCSPVYLAMFDNVSKVTAFDTSGASCACKFIFKGPWVTLNPGMMSSAPALLLLSPVVCYQGPSCFPCKRQTCCYLVTRRTSCPPLSRLTGPCFFTLFFIMLGVLNKSIAAIRV